MLLVSPPGTHSVSLIKVTQYELDESAVIGLVSGNTE